MGLRRVVQRKARIGQEMNEKVARWKRARKALRKEISKVRKKEWKCLMKLIEEDPWGRPYLVAMRKLRFRRNPPLINVDNAEVEVVLNTLLSEGKGAEGVAEFGAGVDGRGESFHCGAAKSRKKDTSKKQDVWSGHNSRSYHQESSGNGT